MAVPVKNLTMEGVEELKQFLESIRFVYGYDFTEYSEASVRRRVQAFMEANRVNSVKELGRIILKDEPVFEKFVQDITVNVTEMFRDPMFYKSLGKNVMGRLATYIFINILIVV